MPFTMRIRFQGLCAFVPTKDMATGKYSAVEVLLVDGSAGGSGHTHGGGIPPTTLGQQVFHRHHPVLIVDAKYIAPSPPSSETANLVINNAGQEYLYYLRDKALSIGSGSKLDLDLAPITPPCPTLGAAPSSLRWVSSFDSASKNLPGRVLDNAAVSISARCVIVGGKLQTLALSGSSGKPPTIWKVAGTTVRQALAEAVELTLDVSTPTYTLNLGAVGENLILRPDPRTGTNEVLVRIECGPLDSILKAPPPKASAPPVYPRVYHHFLQFYRLLKNGDQQPVGNLNLPEEDGVCPLPSPGPTIGDLDCPMTWIEL